MTLVSQMRGTPPTHVVRMRTALTVGPKTPPHEPAPCQCGTGCGVARVRPSYGQIPPLNPSGV